MGTTPEQADMRRKKGLRAVAGTCAAVIVGGTALALATSGPASGHGWEAKAVLRDVSGERVGLVRFEGDRDGTTVKVTLDDAAGVDEFHGFHVHANDAKEQCNPLAPAGPFTNVGGHWSPPATHAHHAGDMPSVLVDTDGDADARFRTERFNPAEIAGKAVILHAGPDNFGNIPTRYSTGGVPGPDATTLSTGDASSRYACGIVVRD